MTTTKQTITNPDGSQTEVEIGELALSEEEGPLARESVPDPTVSARPTLEMDLSEFIDEIELGEIELIERVTGAKISKVLKEFESQDFSARTLLAIVWLALRRQDGDTTDNPSDEEIEAGVTRARKVQLSDIASAGDDDEDGDSVPQ